MILTDQICSFRVFGAGYSCRPNPDAPPKAPQTSTPPSLPDVGPIDSGVTNRLADLYSSTFGSSADQSNLPVVAVPVNPPASGGGGVSLSKIWLLAALGVGGWFLWKKFGAHA